MRLIKVIQGSKGRKDTESAPNPAARIIFVSEAHLSMSQDGRFSSPDGVNGWEQWQVYSISSIGILARVDRRGKAEGAPLGPMRVFALPDYTGLLSFVKNLPMIVKVVLKTFNHHAIPVLRMPGLIGNVCLPILLIRRIPFAIEMVGDPFDVISSLYPTRVGKASAHLARWYMRYAIKRASAVRYVTSLSLQKAYPANSGTPTTSISNVILMDEDRRSVVRSRVTGRSKIRLIAIGSQSTTYKGHDIAIRAVALLRKRKVNASVEFLGSGSVQQSLIDLVHELAVGDAVTFRGHVTDRIAIREALDNSDILIHPSRTEGLPRVVIEGSARGLPVIGTDIGGIPELVLTENIVQVDDVKGLADRIEYLSSDNDAYGEASEYALRIAQNFTSDIRKEKFDAWSDVLLGLARNEPKRGSPGPASWTRTAKRLS